MHGVWILAPGLGQLMVHQGRLEGRGRWGEWSGCGCWIVPCCRQGCMGTAVGTASLGHPARCLATVLGTYGAGHCPAPPCCTSWERHEFSVSLNTGKVLAFGELGAVWDVPLHSAPVLHPSSWTCLGPGVPSLPLARHKAVPRAAGMVQSSLGMSILHPIPPHPTASSFPSYLPPHRCTQSPRSNRYPWVHQLPAQWRSFGPACAALGWLPCPSTQGTVLSSRPPCAPCSQQPGPRSGISAPGSSFSPSFSGCSASCCWVSE